MKALFSRLFSVVGCFFIFSAAWFCLWGMPVPMGTKKIDLCVDKELPTFMQILENVLKEMKVQKIYLADEIKDQNPEQLENIKQELPDVEIEFMPHTDLKKNLAKTHAFIRTGEMTPYSNIILESGVTF